MLLSRKPNKHRVRYITFWVTINRPGSINERASINVKILGPDHFDLARTYLHMGYLRYNSGD